MTDSIYREIILDHSKNPRNFGELDPADLTAEDTNPLCGDQIRMDLRVDDGVVTHLWYPVFPPNTHARDVLAWLRSNPR